MRGLRCCSCCVRRRMGGHMGRRMGCLLRYRGCVRGCMRRVLCRMHCLVCDCGGVDCEGVLSTLSMGCRLWLVGRREGELTALRLRVCTGRAFWEACALLHHKLLLAAGAGVFCAPLARAAAGDGVVCGPAATACLVLGLDGPGSAPSTSR